MKRAYRVFHRARESDAERSIPAILSEKTSTVRSSPAWPRLLSSPPAHTAAGWASWLVLCSQFICCGARSMPPTLIEFRERRGCDDRSLSPGIWTMWWDSSLHLREPDQRHPMDKWCYSSLTRLGRPLENKIGPVLKDLRFTFIAFKYWLVRG